MYGWIPWRGFRFAYIHPQKNINSNTIESKLHFEISELGNVSNVFSCLLSSNFRLLPWSSLSEFLTTIVTSCCLEMLKRNSHRIHDDSCMVWFFTTYIYHHKQLSISCRFPWLPHLRMFFSLAFHMPPGTSRFVTSGGRTSAYVPAVQGSLGSTFRCKCVLFLRKKVGIPSLKPR